jgi:activating signal cointegrator complex subunit 2
MAPYPEAAWRAHMMPEEWSACLDAWVALAEAHLSLSEPDFQRISIKDQSVVYFLLSYVRDAASSSDSLFPDLLPKIRKLWKAVFHLSSRILEATLAPEQLLQWEFLADLAKVYGRKHTWNLLSIVWKHHDQSLESTLGTEKNLLIKELEAGVRGDVTSVEAHLRRLNHLLHASSETCAFFMAGSDFLDGLVSCYKLMNPPLRKVIISTQYLCIVGLTEGVKPNFSLLTDQLYALKAAADAHKAGPTNVNDSLVAELVTVTPILKQLQHRLESSGPGSSRARSVLTSLEGYKKAGGGRPKKLIKRKVNKGKGVSRADVQDDEYGHGAIGQIHVHQMSLITQIQDLFPDLGSGFVAKLLDEYNEDIEQVIAHLLEGSLPAHLQDADRSEELYVSSSCLTSCKLTIN